VNENEKGLLSNFRASNFLIHTAYENESGQKRQINHETFRSKFDITNLHVTHSPPLTIHRELGNDKEEAL